MALKDGHLALCLKVMVTVMERRRQRRHMVMLGDVVWR